MRFCTSELKTAVICRELVKRFPGRQILSVTGIRRQESAGRAKAAAKIRQAAEARIPEHLLFMKGWPTVLPTLRESGMLVEVRRTVAQAVGIIINYDDPWSLRDRYRDLMAQNRAA